MELSTIEDFNNSGRNRSNEFLFVQYLHIFTQDEKINVMNRGEIEWDWTSGQDVLIEAGTVLS